MITTKFTTTALVLLIAILSLAMLIGLLFEQTWAGGSGFVKHQVAVMDGVEFKRGEILDSGDAFRLVEFGNSKLWLDENTQIKIIDGRKDKLVINVIQGRTVIEGKLMVQTREVESYIDGKTSFVHYSWLNEIEVASIEGWQEIHQNHTVTTEGSVRLSTLEPYTFNVFVFEPETSNAVEFYSWALDL